MVVQGHRKPYDPSVTSFDLINTSIACDRQTDGHRDTSLLIAISCIRHACVTKIKVRAVAYDYCVSGCIDIFFTQLL